MRKTLLVLWMCGLGCAVSVAGAGPLKTEFSVLVVFSSAADSGAGEVVLVPGTVIPIAAAESTVQREDAVARSLSFTRAVEKLWSTFRLDPQRRLQYGCVLATALNEPAELPAPPGSSLELTATMVAVDEEGATYRIVFRQDGTKLADSNVTVTRGGRAVVGGMDGEAAPYLFVFVQPDPPHAAAPKWEEGTGLSQPVAKSKVNPSYPEAAKKAKVSGLVVVETIIDVDGAVVDTRILESPDPSLSAAAEEAIRQWRFEPARDGSGTPRKVSFVLTIKFRLQ